MLWSLPTHRGGPQCQGTGWVPLHSFTGTHRSLRRCLSSRFRKSVPLSRAEWDPVFGPSGFRDTGSRGRGVGRVVGRRVLTQRRRRRETVVGDGRPPRSGPWSGPGVGWVGGPGVRRQYIVGTPLEGPCVVGTPLPRSPGSLSFHRRSGPMFDSETVRCRHTGTPTLV